MAAKISAARALARKLFEEKQAAMSAARLAAEQAMDEEEIDRCVADSASFHEESCSGSASSCPACQIAASQATHGVALQQTPLPAICRQCIDV